MSDLDGCLLARFAGRQPPDWLRRWLDDGLGGVLLFASNIAGPQQLRALAAELRSHNPRGVDGLRLTELPGGAGASGGAGVPDGRAELDAIIERGRGRPLVVAVRDAHRLPWQRDLLGRVLARRPDAVVVGTGTVHDRHLAGRGYLGTRGADRVNLEAAADVLLGGTGYPPDGTGHDAPELSP